jgi:hypothetical protein
MVCLGACREIGTITVGAVFGRAATLVGASLLIVVLSSVILPLTWHGPPSALAAAAGKEAVRRVDRVDGSSQNGGRTSCAKTVDAPL